MSLRSAGRLVARCSRLRALQSEGAPAVQNAETASSQPVQSAMLQTSRHMHGVSGDAGSHHIRPQLRQGRPLLLLLRQLHVSAPVLAVEDVVVPSMGDSITEGGILRGLISH